MIEAIERENVIACENCGISTGIPLGRYLFDGGCSKCGERRFWIIHLYKEWSDARVARLVRAYNSVRAKYSKENNGVAEWKLACICSRCSPDKIPKKIFGFIYVYDRIRNAYWDDVKKLITIKIGKNILFNWDYVKWLGIGVRGIAYFPNTFKNFEDEE